MGEQLKNLKCIKQRIISGFFRTINNEYHGFRLYFVFNSLPILSEPQSENSVSHIIYTGQLMFVYKLSGLRISKPGIRSLI